MSQSRRRRAKNPPASGPSGATAWLSSPTANPAALNNFSFILGSQIRYLVNNLSKKNYKSTVSELDHIITLYGHDAFLYLLRCLVEQIDVKDYKIQKDHPKIQLLHQQTLELSKQPNFASVVLQAMAGMEFREDFLTRFCKHLKLPLAQEVLLALGAAQASEAGVLQEGKRFLRSKISEVAQHPSALPPEVLYELLFFVRTKDGFSKHRTNLLRALQKQGPSYIKSLPSTLALLITESEVDMTSDQSFDRNLMTGAFEEQQSLVSAITAACHPSELMEDLGYSCCQARSPGSFKEFLRQFPAITEREVAQMISLMVRTRTGLGEGKEPTSPTSSTSEKDRPQTWNTGVFVSTIKEMFPNLDWPLVIRNLDLPDFEVEDTKALAMVLSIYKKATKLPFPHKALYGSWANPKGQLSFLKLAIFAPPDVINFGDGHEEILTQMPHPNQNASALIHNWTSLPLIETLLHLAAVDDYAEVRGIFDYPIEHCPELLLLKLAQVTPTWGALHSELCSILLPMFVHRHPHKHPNSNFVLSKLWAYNRALFIRAVVDLHSGDSSSIVQSVLGLSQELKIFPEILQVPKFPFVIELAVLAREKGFNLNLGQWAEERIAEYKLDFVRPCFEFLRTMASREDAPGQGLSSEIAAALLTALKNAFPALPPDLVDEHEHLKSTYGVPSSTPQGSTLSLHSPESAPPPVAADASGSAFPATAAPDKEVFPPDIEGPANAYFQSVYTGQMSIDEVVQLLKNFKSSANKREQRIFQCMIHNLFDEYRFFQKYPDKELQITGVLFGQLIQHQLVSYISLGIALRYVLEALKKPPNSKMFKFGMYALTQFKARLVEWPQYCHHILQIPHMQRCSPEVIQFIENAIRTSDTEAGPLEAKRPLPAEPTNSAVQSLGHGSSSFQANSTATPVPASTPSVLSQPPSEPKTPPASPAKSKPSVASSPSKRPASIHLGSSLPLETLEQSLEAPNPPSEEIKDKIVFVFNNVSKQNMEMKAEEMKKIITRDHHAFIAHHLVMYRASIEPNFHQLYLAFLDALKLPKLTTCVLETTYVAIKALLKSSKITSSTQERALLRNLGSWLGHLTLARNKPLLHKHIALQDLILEAYETGRLIAVIPFVSKTLETCKKSKIFAPPNVWVMAIMRLLVAIYQIPTLKLNLKFEIELLCNHLSLELNEIQPAESLKDRDRSKNRVDFTDIIAEITLSPKTLPVTSPLPSTQGATSPTPPTATFMHTVSPTIAPIPAQKPLPTPQMPDMTSPAPSPSPSPSPMPPSPGLQVAPGQPASGPALWSVSPHIVLFSQFPLLKRWIPLAIDRAIKEIITPVMERSAAIASITTRELVLKDFAMEPDEQNMRKAAHHMVHNLAGSLAMVTCKEPLRVSIANHLRSMLQANVADVQPAIIEQAVQAVSNDNLDTACAIIEKATTEKAIRETDDALAGAFEARRKHRERSGSQNFIDPTFFSGRFPSSLPEPLRTKPGGLQLHQKKVYEEFYTLHDIRQKQGTYQATPTSPSPSSSPSPSPTASPSPLPSPPPRTIQIPPAAPGRSTDISRDELIKQQRDDQIDMYMNQHLSIPTGATIIPSSGDSLPYIVSQGVVNSSLGGSADEIDPRRSITSPRGDKQTKPGPKKEKLATGIALQKFKALMSELDKAVKASDAKSLEEVSGDSIIYDSVGQVPELITDAINSNEVALAFAQKVFKRLYEKSDNDLHVDVHIAILECIRDVCKKVVKELTNWVMYSDNDRKFHPKITAQLITSHLLKVTEFDVHLSKKLDSGRNTAAVEFAIHVIRKCMIEARKVAPTELFSTLDTLGKFAKKNKKAAPEGLLQLLAEAKNVTPITSDDKGRSRSFSRSKEEGSSLSRSSKDGTITQKKIQDPSYEQYSLLWEEWKRICQQPTRKSSNATPGSASDKDLSSVESYIMRLQQNILSEEQLSIKQLFRVCTVLSVEECASVGPHSTTPSYRSVETLAKLVTVLFRFLPSGPVSANGSRLNVLNKILGTIVHVLIKTYESKRTQFDQRPFARLLLCLLGDFGVMFPDPDPNQLQVLVAFCNAFIVLSPTRLPGFCIAWLELISHCSFMPKLLLSNPQEGWPYFQQLLVELFKFLEPYLRNAELTESVRLLYKGTLRVLLVLLHDFPEFLCDYHFSFCDVIPPTCIQMRNLILSAFPRNMRLPDPFTPNLKVDLLPEINQPPHILSDYTAVVRYAGGGTFKQDLDLYLKSGSPMTFLLELRSKLLNAPLHAPMMAIGGSKYNIPLINALVLYVGTQAIAQLQSSSSSHATSPITQSAPMDIFQHLAMDLDNEGRYLFFNAIANQLRYPNTHTHYFSCVLLYLFAEANQAANKENIQEQITRVLLERLIVNRPHPWGLLITFIELIKNPRYNFWSHGFTRCAPEIERLFESVARSCMGPAKDRVLHHPDK